MVIDRIHIRTFGALREKEMTFDAGLNIIEGENESGKTTVAAFIRYLFYGFGDRAEADRYLAFSPDGILSGFMDCTADDGEGMPAAFRISRTLCKAFPGAEQDLIGEAEIRRLDTDEPVFAGQEPGEVFFGVSGEVFSSTAFVRQVSAARIPAESSGNVPGTAVSAPAVRDAISHILYAANEEIDPQAAVERLAVRRNALYDTESRSGSVYDMEKQRTALASRMEAAMQEDTEIRDIRRTIADCDSRIRTHAARSAQLTTLYGQYEQYVKLDDTSALDDLRLSRASAEKRALSLSSAMFRGDYIPDDAYTEELRHCAQDMREAAEDRNLAQKELEKLEFSARRDNIKEDLLRRIEVDGGVELLQKQAGTLRTRLPIVTALGVIALILAVFSTVTTLFMILLHAEHIPQYLIITAILAAFAAYLFVMRSRDAKALGAMFSRYHCETADELENFFEVYQLDEGRFHRDSEEKDTVREQLSACSLRYDEAAREAALLLCRLQPPGAARITPERLTDQVIDTAADRIEKALVELARMQEQIDSCEEQIMALAAECGIEAQDCDDAVARWEDTRASLSTAFGGKSAKDYNPEPILRELDFNQKTDAALGQKIEKLRAVLAEKGASEADEQKDGTAPHRAADPNVLSGLLDVLDARLCEDRRTYSALNLAMEKLQCASTRLHDEIAPRLMTNSGLLMRNLTDWRYKELGLDENQQLTYRTADGTEAEGPLPVDYMSAGTQDLAYLSLRMALVHMLYQKELPPLLFDEAFATLDDRRLSRMVSLLFSAAESDETPGAQALVFTCHKRERSAAEAVRSCNVISLS